MALRRVWAAERFSWRLTKLLHVFPDDDAFETRIKLSEFDHLQPLEARRGHGRRAICRLAVRGLKRRQSCDRMGSLGAVA